MSSSKLAANATGSASKPTTLAPPRVWTAQALVELLHVSTLAQITLYVRGFAQAALIKRGTSVATARVVEQGAQIVGEAATFMASATASQKRLLATVTPGFLSAASTGLHLAAQLDAKVSRRRAKAVARRQVAKVTEDAALPPVRARRDLFCTHLVAMASGDGGWITRIQNACGAAPDGAALATSIETMVTEGRALMAHVKSQGGEVTVDEAYVAEMTDLAETARTAGSGGGGASNDSSAQAELDWWDGVNLWFITTLVDNFEKARKVDSLVPRLKLGALKNIIKPGRARAKRAKKTPVTPA